MQNKLFPRCHVHLNFFFLRVHGVLSCDQRYHFTMSFSLAYPSFNQISSGATFLQAWLSREKLPCEEYPLCLLLFQAKAVRCRMWHCQLLLPPCYFFSQCHFSYTGNSAMVSFCFSAFSRQEVWMILLLTNMGEECGLKLVLIF